MKNTENVVINSMVMSLNSGRRVDVFNLQEEDVDVNDIAHALSNLCRWGGHCPYFYSVAQHSVLCSYESGTIEQQLEYLMHDASEAYMVDLPRPIKHRIPKYREEEDKVLSIILKKYDLNENLSKRTKEVDNFLLIREYDSFFGVKSNKIQQSLYPECDFEGNVKCWTPKKAKKEFIKRFKELIDGR